MAVPPLHCGVTGALYSIRGLVELSAAERYTTTSYKRRSIERGG